MSLGIFLKEIHLFLKSIQIHSFRAKRLKICMLGFCKDFVRSTSAASEVTEVVTSVNSSEFECWNSLECKTNQINKIHPNFMTF